MKIVIDLIILGICFFFLIKGSELILRGSVSLAERFGISKLVIASTLIALGTGLPTIAVNLFLVVFGGAGLDVAIGNAIGTNYVNIGLGLGIPAFLMTIVTKYEVFEKEIPIYLCITALLTAFAYDGVISSIEGIVILLVYIVTLFVIYQYSLREKLNDEDKEQIDIDTSTISEIKKKGEKLSKSLLFIFIGFIALVASSLFLVSQTNKFSLDFGISPYILGVTLIGIGTSIPMIYTSIRSAKKGYSDIIVGNVFGSTIANIALGIGLPAILVPLMFNKEIITDLYNFNLLNIFVIFGLLIEMKLLGKNKSFNWVSGLIIVVLYLAYLTFKIVA